MWNEMGNSNTSLKEERDVSAKAIAKTPLDDALEEAEAVLYLTDEAGTTDGAQEESTQDEVGRDDMKHEFQRNLAEEPADPPREAEESALDSQRQTGPMDGCGSTVRDGSEKVDTCTLPEVVEEPNRQEHENGWQGKRIKPSVCMSLENAAMTPDTNAKSAAEGGTEKSTKSLLNDTGTETSLEDKGELLGPAEPKAGGLSASNELGSVDGKDSAIASTLPSSANQDDTLAEIDAPIEEKISTVQDIREDDDNLMEETDNTLAEMKSLQMGEPGDPVKNGIEVTDSIEKTRRNSSSSMDLDNAILHQDQSILLQPDDDTRVEDESIVLVKSTNLIGIPSTTDITKVGRQFECGAERSPSEDALAPNLENTDARTKIVGDLDCTVDEEGAFEAVKATEYGIVNEGFPTPREECCIRLTRDISTIRESEEVVDGIAEAEKPTEDTNSGIKSNARASYEEFQAFDPLKLNQLELFPLPINEEASKVKSDGGDGLSREDIEVLGSRGHGSKPDKAINLRIKKSPSFDFDLRIISTEESDRTPLLFQDKRVVRTATAMTADYGNAEKKKLPISKERILSFGHADSRTPSLFSREEHDAGGFHNHDISEKQENVLLLDPAKDLEVVDRPSSGEQKGKRRPRSSLFGNCMCCATVMN